MDRQNRNNRSLLALAGENSLIMNSSKTNYQPIIARMPQTDFMINKSNTKMKTEQSNIFDSKQILKKLGLARLRKMQALVRGFLVRRKVYPKQLEQYLVAQSAMDLIIANVIYGQVSGIVVQAVTLGHYDQGEGGEDRLIEEHLYNAVIKRVIEKEFAPIARQAVYETAIYASRPQITFGFNLRDPLQLTLFLKLNSIIEQECRGLVEEALRQQALQRRQLQIIDSLILDMGVITDLCHQVVDECLLEGVEDYAVQQIFNKITKEAAAVFAEVVYNEQVLKIQNKFLDSLTEQAEEWLLQQFMLTLICDPQKLQPKYE